jgi:hypothetical protein
MAVFDPGCVRTTKTHCNHARTIVTRSLQRRDPSSWRVRLLSQAWNEIYGMSVEHRLLHLDIGSPDYLAVPPNTTESEGRIQSI